MAKQRRRRKKRMRTSPKIGTDKRVGMFKIWQESPEWSGLTPKKASMAKKTKKMYPESPEVRGSTHPRDSIGSIFLLNEKKEKRKKKKENGDQHEKFSDQHEKFSKC